MGFGIWDLGLQTGSIKNVEMKIFYINIILCFLISCPLIGFAQGGLDTLSLERLIEMAKDRSIFSEAAKFELKSAHFNFSIYKSGLKPQINGTAKLPNYAKTSREIEQPDGTVLFQPVTNNNSSIGIQAIQNITKTGGAVFLESNLQRFDNFESNESFYNGSPIRLGIFQPLFGFNEFKWDKKLAPMKLREAEKKYSADMEEINLDASELFFNLLIANEDLNIAISNKEGNQSLFDIAQERYDLGKISQNDLMALRLELISATRNKKRAEQAVQFASSKLYTFLGLDYDGQMIVPQIPKIKEGIAVDAAFALQQALKNRYEIDAQTRTLLEAERDIAEVKGNGGFNADLTASVGLARGSINLEDVYTDPKQEQFVTLSLNIPIVDWGRQKSEVNLSKAKRDFIQKQISQDRLALETNIRQVVRQYQNLQEELKLVEEFKTVAQERFEITKKSYLLSAISITELTLAHREKDQAVREYISTLGLFWTNYFTLQLMTVYDFEKREIIKY
ncbi:MAG: outer membrane protein [Saprospiraceae bacterium]